MKPAKFEYHAPSSLTEALALLGELRGQDSKVLAGGQSLVPLLNMRLARPGHVVDINGLRELDYINPTADGGLAVGALTRQRTLEKSPEVARRAPLLAEAMPLVGDRQVRTRGTVGGSLAHADPVAELPTVAVALDAELVLASRGQTRTVRASEFFVTFLTTLLEEDELLVEVRFPPPRPGAGQAFLELTRQRGAYAIVSAAAVLALENNRVVDARLSLGGVAPTPIGSVGAQAVLSGQEPSEELFSAAARVAAEDVDPSPDVHGTVAYRREMAQVYAKRALKAAASRATSR